MKTLTASDLREFLGALCRAWSIETSLQWLPHDPARGQGPVTALVAGTRSSCISGSLQRGNSSEGDTGTKGDGFSANWNSQLSDDLADELVRMKVDVIVTAEQFTKPGCPSIPVPAIVKTVSQPLEKAIFRNNGMNHAGFPSSSPGVVLGTPGCSQEVTDGARRSCCINNGRIVSSAED